ncbi:polyprenyl synthetase [Methylobacterium sp. ME121]|nr:polyprenyl synthetase [Methylobacterium sp. ME121]
MPAVDALRQGGRGDGDQGGRGEQMQLHDDLHAGSFDFTGKPSGQSGRVRKIVGAAVSIAAAVLGRL